MCARACVAVDCECEGEEKSQGGIRHFYRLRQRGFDSSGAAVAARPGVCDYIARLFVFPLFEAASNCHKAHKSQQYAMEKTAKYA